jgi:transcriptional regulator with XRE-family HTH domain
MSNLSKNLSRLRTEKGYSQEFVSDTIGLSRQSYSLTESGKRDITMAQAEALASLYRVTITQLAGSPDEQGTLQDHIQAVQKYKQIILNALEFGGDSTDGRLTKTKLAKLVYLADFIWYFQTQSPMSGMSYRKLPQGPVPDIFFRALDELEDEGAIEREDKKRAMIYSLVSKTAPKNKLDAKEIALIQAVGEAWKDKHRQEIVDFTHEQLPWQICREGEVIPYGLITQEETEKVYGPVKL